jgi:two-component system, sensor histidine kinase LadS
MDRKKPAILWFIFEKVKERPYLKQGQREIFDEKDTAGYTAFPSFLKKAGAILLIILLLSGPGAAAAVEIGPDFQSLAIQSQLEILQDPGGKLTYQDVSSPLFSQEFEEIQEHIRDGGMAPSIFWYRFQVETSGSAAKPTRLILVMPSSFFQELDLFAPVKGTADAHTSGPEAGVKHYTEEDGLKSRFPAFVLPANLNYSRPIYLRVQSRILIHSLWLKNQTEMDRFQRFEYLFFGLIHGVLTAMLLYNLVLAIFLRDKTYYTYCLYIACINGYVAILGAWPVGLGLSRQLLIDWVLVFFAATYFFGMVFTRLFLNTAGRLRCFDRLLLLFMGLALLCPVMALIGLFSISDLIANTLGLVSPVVIMAAAAMRWRQGYQPARYYLAAWAFLYCAAIIFSASGLGLIKYNWLIASGSMGLGASMESILLSLALADRIRDLQEERQRLQEQEQRLTELSITDELTGLFNKRWFTSKIASEMDHARRMDRPLSLIVLDVDDFKSLNDRFGHHQGDLVLSELGRVISRSVRSTDIACRYGGEEFSIIMPGADKEDASVTAERLRRGTQSMQILAEHGKNVTVTVSLGVARMRTGEDADTLFVRADSALYQAKDKGKNQTVAAS